MCHLLGDGEGLVEVIESLVRIAPSPQNKRAYSEGKHPRFRHIGADDVGLLGAVERQRLREVGLGSQPARRADTRYSPRFW